MTAPSPQSTSADEISLAELYAKVSGFANFVLGDWRLLLLPMGIAVAAGLFIAFGNTPEYSASARLVPYRVGGVGASGNLAGLAGLAGIRLPTGGAGELVITTDIYPDLAASFDFRAVVATTPIAFMGRDSLLSSAAFFSENSRRGLMDLVARYTVGLPGLVLSTLRPTKVTESNSVRQGGPVRVDPKFERTVRDVGERIGVNVDRKSGIITISATMPDPVAAADLVRATANHLTETIISYEVRKTDEQLSFLDEQYAVAKSRYDLAQRNLAAFADRNRMLGSATAQIEQDRLSREVESAFELFQQFNREREQARIKKKQDTPVFAVLQAPTVPNGRSSPHRTKIVLIALFFGFLSGICRIAWRRYGAAQPVFGPDPV